MSFCSMTSPKQNVKLSLKLKLSLLNFLFLFLFFIASVLLFNIINQSIFIISGKHGALWCCSVDCFSNAVMQHLKSLLAVLQ